MLNAPAGVGWREARRQSARAALLATAWEKVREDGLAALSLRELARRAGITTPTVYAYFESKNAIFDAMFGEAAASFAESKTAAFDTGDPHQTWPPMRSDSSSSARPTSPVTSCCSSTRFPGSPLHRIPTRRPCAP